MMLFVTDNTLQENEAKELYALEVSDPENDKIALSFKVQPGWFTDRITIDYVRGKLVSFTD